MSPGVLNNRASPYPGGRGSTDPGEHPIGTYTREYGNRSFHRENTVTAWGRGSCDAWRVWEGSGEEGMGIPPLGWGEPQAQGDMPLPW